VFPTTITLTISSPEQLAQAMAAMAHMCGTPVTPPAVQAADLTKAPKPKAEKTAPAPTPAPPAEPTAPSPPTVEEAVAAAPVQSTEPAAPPPATAPAADASSADEFPYSQLAAAVNAALGKHGKAALSAIALKHGAATFKALPPTAWKAAHDDVVALGA
jgi:hypothetical protein